MGDLVYGPLAELLGHVFYAGIVGVLAVIGTVAEGASVQNLTAGQTVLGLWEAAFGLVLLYAGYNVFRHALLPRFRSVES